MSCEHIVSFFLKGVFNHRCERNIIINQVVDYNAASTQTVKYYKSGTNFVREVDGAATVIARDVSDFNVNITDTDETAVTQITFRPIFHFNASADATAGTTYTQTTLLRNTR